MKKSFSLIELIIAILIVGILAAIAVPKMISFREEAEFAAEQKVLGNIRSGISIYYIESAVSNRLPLFPDTLEGSNPSALFDLVLSPGVTNGKWKKTGTTDYEAPSGTTYNYDPIAGTFLD